MRNYLLLFIFLLGFFPLSAQIDSILFDSQQRTYLLHLPVDYSPTEKLPLLVAMHGGFGSALNLQSQSLLSEKADKEKFIVVYPEGVKGGALDIRTWNAGACCGHASTNNVDDVGFINALLDHLIPGYAVDTERIYATGMSNGGFMAYRLACELSDRIAAIASVGSSMTVPDCMPSRAIPIIHFHSYLDENIPSQGGVGSGPSTHYNISQDSIHRIWTKLNGCTSEKEILVDNEEYTFIRYDDCACESRVDHYTTQDGGHSWPGGNAGPLGDPTSEFINANDLMWSFFQGYSLACDNTTSLDPPLRNNADFTVFPNPSSGLFYCKSPLFSKTYQLTVFDGQGKQILEVLDTPTLDLSGQLPGLYYLRIKTEEELVIRKMLKMD